MFNIKIQTKSDVYTDNMIQSSTTTEILTKNFDLKSYITFTFTHIYPHDKNVISSIDINQYSIYYQ